MKYEKWFAWHPVKVNGSYKWLQKVTRYKKPKYKSTSAYTSIFEIGKS